MKNRLRVDDYFCILAYVSSLKAIYLPLHQEQHVLDNGVQKVRLKKHYVHLGRYSAWRLHVP